MVTRTWITSPRAAEAGTWISVRAAMSGSGAFDAGRQHDDHVDAVGPHGAVVHARERDQLLAGRQPDARGDVGLAGTRPELEAGHLALRVLLVEHGDLGHVVGRGHGALDA